jgi:CheY-like chemotaxis protein
MALTKEHVDFSEIIEAAVTVVRPLFESKGLYLMTNVPQDLPTVFCDRTRIREVLINLLSNAGRFTERGGARVHACQQGRSIVVSVSDTGPGIPADDMDRVFQPFQQLDGSIRRRYGGTGLGLSISRQFVELHAGKIEVESQPGAGSTFSIRLPLAPPMSVTSTPARWLNPDWEYRLRTERSAAPVMKPLPRFVVLERGSALRRLLLRYLRDVEIVSPGDLDEAMRELSSVPSRALLVNDPSPRTALRSLAERGTLPGDIPTIICEVAGGSEAADALGASDYVVKPVSRDDLLAAMSGLGANVRTILIVDDQPDALRLFHRMLGSAERGYRVFRARDGREALNILRHHTVDAILLDLIMPDMDGFQLLKEKNEDPALRDIPVIVVSARDPAGQPIVSRALTITRGRGLSMHHLLECIEAVTSILSTSSQAAGPVSQVASAG